MTSPRLRDEVRIDRMRGWGRVGQILGREKLASSRPLIGLTSSRLGHDVSLHRRVCHYLSRSMLDCRDLGGCALVAEESAIQPWAERAATLFGVPILAISVASSDASGSKADVRIVSDDLSRDSVLCAVADRVDAVHIRRAGNIEVCLRRRLGDRQDASTRVAIMGGKQDAAASLIAAGAIGWYLAGRSDPTQASRHDLMTGTEEDWARTDGQWLIHCTRSRLGPWPDESPDQYRDSMLVDHPAASRRAPIDALERILWSRRLIASAVTTTKKVPVVCFSALPLASILKRRCFRPHLGRWDYEPFGVAIRRSVLEQMGGRPVIYGEGDQRNQILPADRFRFQSIGKTYDWRAEREWRTSASVDLQRLPNDSVRVFASDSSDARQKLGKSPWPVTWLTSNP